ncbi:MAG TPA: hypothetical protein VMG98_09535 [Verrucomicrobiae bacterium]|nr:hypothetical protein [Verrucomicrobiae bacterium]
MTSIMRWLRAILTLAAVATGVYVVLGLPVLGGPAMWQFLALMVLPLIAAVALAPRTIRFAFLAGAIYSVLAGLRRLLVPEGNATAAEQLSTAALVALLVPILATAWRWTGERAVRSVIKGLQAK